MDRPSELRPCWSCGGVAFTYRPAGASGDFARCIDPQCVGSLSVAVDSWNRRAPDRAALVEVARRAAMYVKSFRPAPFFPGQIAERIVNEYLAEQAGKDAE